jgi:hypothetical protein
LATTLSTVVKSNNKKDYDGSVALKKEKLFYRERKVEKFP